MLIAGGRFLVTGGAGFIGSALVRRLLADGAAEVRVFDLGVDPGRLPAHDAVRAVAGDITDPARLREAMAGCDGVFHMAVLPIGPCEQDPRACFEVNVRGTFNAVEAAHAAGVGKVVFSSASSVYGDTLETMDEAHPLGARSIYGASKIAGEYFLRAFHASKGLDYVVLRYMNVYGPGQRGGLIANTVGRLLRGERPVIVGDGRQSFDFVYVDDVAAANVAAMASDATDEVFNVGSGGEATVREVVDKLIELTGADLEPELRADERALMQRRVGSSAKAAAKLGFRTSVPLDEGLARVIAFERQRVATAAP